MHNDLQMRQTPGPYPALKDSRCLGSLLPRQRKMAISGQAAALKILKLAAIITWVRLESLYTKTADALLPLLEKTRTHTQQTWDGTRWPQSRSPFLGRLGVDEGGCISDKVPPSPPPPQKKDMKCLAGGMKKLLRTQVLSGALRGPSVLEAQRDNRGGRGRGSLSRTAP